MSDLPASEPASPASPLPVAGPPRRRWLKITLGVCSGVAALALLALAFFLTTGYGYDSLTPAYVAAHTCAPEALAAGPKDAKPLSPQEAERILDKIRPKGVFIIVDRVQNRLLLREGDKVLLNAVVSAGAGSELDDPAGKRHWVFDTPVGRFYVKGKRENPVWTAPDWDYIESGEPIPKRYSERVQEGMLGEYALDLGGGPPGYMIHGTLYTRLLGKNVSHGCIRVGRDDLRIVWKKVPVGASVFMY
jgi:L,D-transpeptidase ErfK/SrfK